MYLTTLAAAALPLLASASPLEKLWLEHAPDRFKGIHGNLTIVYEKAVAINGVLDVINAGNETAAYNGTSAFNLYEYGAAISTALNSTIYAANVSRTETEEQSKRTYHYLDTMLYPATSSLLESFISHYAAVSNTGIAGLVVDVLITQRQYSQELGPALIAISNGTSVYDSEVLTADFVAAFDKTIDYYQNPPTTSAS